MFNIEIDISGTVEEFQLLVAESKRLSSQILDRLTDEYMQRWETTVGQELNQTKGEYMRAMQLERPNEFEAVIRLSSRESKLALMLEDGAYPWDIKEELRQGPNKKTAIGGGWYTDVPFRFATSKAIASSPAFTGIAPAGVIRAAKKAGGRAVPLSKLPKEYQKAGIRREIKRGFTIPEYQHKVSVYAGIRRTETGVPGGRKSGVYNTFRRVSDNSDDLAWIHPGFTARKFMDKTLNGLEVSEIVDSVVQNYLNGR